MKFSRVHLENWRNFILVDARLQQRVFLVGPNAAGKSNLLDAFRFLRDIVRIGGGFEKAVSDRGGVTRLRSLVASRHPDLVIDVTMQESDSEQWRYRLVFTQDNQRRPTLKEEKVWKQDVLLLDRPDEMDQSDSELLHQTHLEQISSNRSFREIGDFFNTIRYYHIVPQLVREPDRSMGRKFDPYGGDLLEQIANSPRHIQESRLRRIEKVLRLAIPQLQALQLYKDERGIPHLQGKYDHWQSKGAWQTEVDFSDGTLRLIGLLWALLEGSGPLILEEPELSLHSEVINRIPQIMAQLQKAQRKQARQILVSTHSSDLLSDEGIAPDEVVILQPTGSGTTVEVGINNLEIKQLLDSGLTIAEAVLPQTRPPKAGQISFWE